ncbi:MAG TPA: Tol-Pal system beta propeller repeat protein TolB [Elusimicrobiota bacterium]|jgi:TolB protein|nr:Tol-Pal system beta propeller repeat protein TolB [Elusimicrobiota bacterium]
MIRLLALAAVLAAPAGAQTQVRISVGGGSSEPAPVLALPVFTAADSLKGEDALLAKGLRDIVRSDLMLSRRFDVQDELPGAPPAAGAAWRLKASVGREADKITAQVRLENGAGGEAVFERYYKQDAKWLRPLAHRISDDVVKAATGRDGIARTRIAFINNQSGHKELYLMDYDGDSPTRLTDDKSIDLLPRFSPDGRDLAFTSYKDGNPDLFMLDLDAGREITVSNEQGLNIAGGFSPDGTKLLMTLSRGRSPNIYMKDMASGSVERLTFHFGADSTPTFSPDARQVAFVSDRSGNPQIYVLDIATKQSRRLTNLNWCDSPAWSPTGEWIAFAGRANRKDRMDIFLVDITGGQIRQLTHGEGSNEDPTWSPDGRLLAFSSTRDDGRSQIYVMDADGSAPRRIADVPGASSTPDWSGFRP